MIVRSIFCGSSAMVVIVSVDNEPGALDEVEVIWARGVKALFGFSLSVEG